MSKMRWFIITGTLLTFALSLGVFWALRLHRKEAMPSPVPGARKEALAIVPSSQPVAESSPHAPMLYPGDTCKKASELYGASDETDQFVRTWRKKDFQVYASVNANCVFTSIVMTVEPGHTVLTNDGVRLGSDTLAEVEHILRARLKDGSESVDAPEGNWEGLITLGPTSTANYTVIYRTASDSTGMDQLSRDPTFKDFRGQIVTERELDLASPIGAGAQALRTKSQL